MRKYTLWALSCDSSNIWLMADACMAGVIQPGGYVGSSSSSQTSKYSSQGRQIEGNPPIDSWINRKPKEWVSTPPPQPSHYKFEHSCVSSNTRVEMG